MSAGSRGWTVGSIAGLVTLLLLSSAGLAPGSVGSATPTPSATAGGSGPASPSLLAVPGASGPSEVQNTTNYCGNVGTYPVAPGSTCSTSLTNVAAGDALIYQVFTSYGCANVPTISTKPSLGAAAYNFTDAQSSSTAAPVDQYCSWTWIFFNVPAASTQYVNFTAATECSSGCPAGATDDYGVDLTEVHGAGRLDALSASTGTGPSSALSTTLSYSTNTSGDLLYSTFTQLRCVGTLIATATWTTLPGLGPLWGTNTCGNVGGFQPAYKTGAPAGSGSLTYTVGYAKYNGYYTVGAGRIIALAASLPVGGGVTFDESGLASGTSWSVTLNGSATPHTSTSSAISVSLKNATYTYAVGAVAGYVIPVNSTGGFSVRGVYASVNVTFSLVTYPVSFTESGLSGGASWSVTLAGTTRTATAPSSPTFVEGNGTYALSAGATGYSLTASGCGSSITVSGAAVSCSFTFGAIAYPTEIQNTSTYCHTSSACTTSLSGVTAGDALIYEITTSESCSVAPKVSTTPTLTYAVNDTAGPALINAGANNAGNPGSPANFCSWTYVYFGVPGGTVSFSFITATCPSGSCELSTSYDYGVYLVEVTGSAHLDSANTGTVVTTPSGTGSTSTTLTYATGQGGDFLYDTFAYLRCTGGSTIPSGWTALTGYGTPSYNTCGNVGGSVTAFQQNAPLTGSGAVTIPSAQPSAGAGQVLAFAPGALTKYPVTFTESGLPSGTTWGITLAGTTVSTTRTSLTINATNGSYSYSVTNVPGYRASAYTGPVTVSGAAPSPVATSFSIAKYAVTFGETGLTTGSWSVTANGTSASAAVPSAIAFDLANGSGYAYAVSPVAHYSALPASGSFSVSGAALSIPIRFASPGVYAVTFNENGLSSGTSWSVTLNGTSQSTATNQTVFSVRNATGLVYSIANVPGWRASAYAGSLTVAGHNATVTTRFTLTKGAVTFSETGLPGAGGPWGVTFNGTSSTAAVGASIAFAAPNGTFGYSVAAYAGYVATPSGGTLIVVGATPVTIAFSTAPPTPAAPFLVQNLSSYCGNAGTPPLSLGGVCTVSMSGVAAGDALIYQIVTSYGCGNVPVVSTYPSLPAPSASWMDYQNTSTAPADSYCSWTYVYVGLPSVGTVYFNFTTVSQCTSCIGGTTDDYAIYLSLVEGAQRIDSISPMAATGPTSASSTTIGYTTSATNDFLYSSFGQLRCVKTSTVTTGWTYMPSIASLWGSNTCGNVGGFGPTYLANATLGSGSVVYGVGQTTANGYYTVGAGRVVALEGGFPVTFNASGLPAGTTWSVTFNGVTDSAAAPNGVAFDVQPGTYSYTVAPVAGFVASPSSGSITVSAAVSVSVVFSSGSHFAVTFSESGLPAGTAWAVTLSGATNATLAPGTNGFVELNATYAYTVGVVAGWVASPRVGSVTVSGRAVGVTITFSRLYYTQTFTETGLLGSVVWSVTVNGTTQHATSPSPIAFAELVNGTGYVYSVGTLSSYTATPSSGTFAIAGASGTIAISFSARFHVTFDEAGLPAGTSWGITLNGTLRSSAASSITFPAPAGTYDYTVEALSGWSASRYAGTVPVSSNTTVPTIVFTQVVYPVTFSETGLPVGTSWLVTFAGTTNSSAAPGAIGFAIANGSWSYSVEPIPGYAASAYAGTVGVAGAPQGIALEFSAFTSSVVFAEKGLPQGTAWSVEMNGVTNSTAAPGENVFTETNGSYTYLIGAVASYHTKWSSLVTVDGTPLRVNVTFSLSTYTVSFEEGGLPSGSSWSATLNGSTVTKSSTTIDFDAQANGTFAYSIGAVPGYTTTWSGTVTVSGSSVVQPVRFSPYNLTVTFLESGLPTTAAWNVTIGSTTLWASGGLVTFSLTNHSYVFHVGPPSGYSAYPSTGSLTVSGSPLSELVQFNSTRSSSPSTLPWTEIYVGAGVGIVVLLAVMVLLLRSRGSKGTSGAARPARAEGTPAAAPATPASTPASGDEEAEIYGESP